MGTEKMKHTEGLLTWGYRYIAKPDQNEAGGYKHIAMHPSGEMQPEGGEWEANARRLVACWNACKGMSTETLELMAVGPGVKEIFDEHGQLWSQRNQLLEALKELVDLYVQNQGTKYEFILCITPNPVSQLTATERVSNPAWVAFDKARATIAACGGE